MAISNVSNGFRPGVCTSTTRPTAPFEGQMIYETDTDMLAIYNGSAWRYVAATTPTNGTVLQVVTSADDTTQRSSTSATYVDSGLSATITPKASTSKVMCLYFIQGYSSAATTGLGIRLVRGSTTLVTDVDNAYGSASGNAFNYTFFYLDSPSSTSALTYKVQYARNQGSGTVYLNSAGTGVGVCRMLVMEIAA